MSRELNEQCAKALGYTVYHYDKDYAENCYYQLMDEELDPVIMFPFRAGERKTEDEAWADVPAFSTDYEAARILEDEIERRGLQIEYAKAVMKLIYQQGFKNYAEPQWLLIRATPEQKARAFLEAIKQ